MVGSVVRPCVHHVSVERPLGAMLRHSDLRALAQDHPVTSLPESARAAPEMGVALMSPAELRFVGIPTSGGAVAELYFLRGMRGI